jgi:hypothetical protein
VQKQTNSEHLNIEEQKVEQDCVCEESREHNTGEVDIMSADVVESMKKQATTDIREVLQQLEKTHSGLTEGMATALGAGTGAAGSLAALSSLGAVSGLSAAGVTTGLAAAGGLLGGGMLVGLGVLTAPVAALGVFGYSVAKKRKKVNDAAALGLAAKKIYEIQSRLILHEESFKEEIAYIRTTLEVLTNMKSA